MKKIAVLLILLTFAFVTSTFAATATSSADGQSISSGTEIIAKLSANVRATVNYDDAAGANYALATKATKGTKIYGTASDDTSLYSKAGTANTALVAGDLTEADSSEFDSGWTEM